MNRNVLMHYADTAEEVKDLRRRIIENEKRLEKIEKEGTVRDTVSGGMGGTQHFLIEGIPTPEIGKKRLLLQKRKKLLEEKEVELLELMNQAEEYINSIEKSELRIMFRFYYIDGLTWVQVAHKMNRMFPNRKVAYNDKSLQKRNERFFAENEKMSPNVVRK